MHKMSETQQGVIWNLKYELWIDMEFMSIQTTAVKKITGVFMFRPVCRNIQHQHSFHCFTSSNKAETQNLNTAAQHVVSYP